MPARIEVAADVTRAAAELLDHLSHASNLAGSCQLCHTEGMTNDATTAPPADTPAAPRYSESLHVLVDEPTRAAAMGLAVITAAAAGPGVRPKEGESIRGLLETALDHIRTEAPTLYADALVKGRAALAARKRNA